MTDDSRNMVVAVQKTCRDCGEQKDHSEFYTQGHNGGLRPNCKACVNERSRKRYVENHEDYLTKRAKFREENRDQVREKARDYNRVARAKRAPSISARDMSREEYTDLHKAQGGRCYLCGRDLVEVRTVVDHDHRCCGRGKSCAVCRRGIACINCNSLIGMAYDDPDRLRRVADALEIAQAEVDARSHDQEKALNGRPVAVRELNGSGHRGDPKPRLIGQLALFPVVRGKIGSYKNGYGNKIYTPEERSEAQRASYWRYAERKRDELRVRGEYVPPNIEKTHCPSGHPYNEENTRWYKGNRMCRACHREHTREYSRENAQKIRVYRDTPEYRDRVNARQRELRKQDGDKIRERERVRYQARRARQLEEGGFNY